MYEVNSPLSARIISMQNIKHSEGILGSTNAKSVLERCGILPPYSSGIYIVCLMITTSFQCYIINNSNDYYFLCFIYLYSYYRVDYMFVPCIHSLC